MLDTVYPSSSCNSSPGVLESCRFPCEGSYETPDHSQQRSRNDVPVVSRTTRPAAKHRDSGAATNHSVRLRSVCPHLGDRHRPPSVRIAVCQSTCMKLDGRRRRGRVASADGNRSSRHRPGRNPHGVGAVSVVSGCALAARENLVEGSAFAGLTAHITSGAQ